MSVSKNRCPSCGPNLPGGTSYCAKCGYGTKDGNPRRVPFPWLLIASMMFFVPLALCGGCTMLGISYDAPTKGAFDTFAYIEYSSVGIGIVMILVNLVVLLWRAK